MATRKTATTTCTVIEPLLHNGTRYQPGDAIQLDATHADALNRRRLVQPTKGTRTC